MPTPKEQLKTIRIIHFGLMAGPTFFAAVVAFLIISQGPAIDGSPVLNYLAPACFIVALLLYPLMFRNAVRKVKSENMELPEKMTTFQTGHVIRLAILEGAALLSAVVALTNGAIYHLITVGLILALMFTKFPTPVLLESELELTPEEKEQLSS